jgi:uncharacterized membrane protein YphA (DoxX/SURF4 family)
MTRLHSFIFALIALATTACSTAPNETQWPNNIPARHTFLDYYNQDIEHKKALKEEDYLTWVHRFYFGWELYRRGWVRATNELVDSLDDTQNKPLAKQLMTNIGDLIAPEWAKDKRFHLIKTRHIVIWGNTINAAIVKKEQLLILHKILADVNALLEQRMTPETIQAERYYPQETFGKWESTDDF